MYQTNPRFRSESVRHANLGNPQMTGPLQQTGNPSEGQQTQPSPGLSTQQTPEIGDLAAQLAELQARQSSLEAQQAQRSTQGQPAPLSPIAQQMAPRLQPTPTAPSQQPQQQQPQQHQQPQQQLQPQPYQSQQPQQQPQQQLQPQQPPQASPQAQGGYQAQLQGIPSRLRSMLGIPLQGQQSQPGQQPQRPQQAQQSPIQHPMMQQSPQINPQLQGQQPSQGMQPQSQIGPQGSQLQAQMGPQIGQQGMGPQAGQQQVRQPPVDILDEGEHLVLEIELPGARKEDIQLTGQQNAIQLNVPTRQRRERENLLQSERGQVIYQRSIPLGIEIDSEQIEASFEEGVLRVRAPKRDPKSGPQRIEID